jgi:serine/threonine-protein kinase RsbW
VPRWRLPGRPLLVAELSLRIPGGPGAPAEARRALRRFHTELPVEVTQIMTLLTSELVANAVRHAGARLVELTCSAAAERVRVEVADAGDGSGRKPLPRAPDHTGGWGLHMLDELSSRWGVIDGTGTRVWFEIDRD